MPVDKDGNRAEVIMDGLSTIKRMNIGRLYEHYYNAASRDVTKRVRGMIAADNSKKSYEAAFNYLVSYYQTVSPKMGELFTSGKFKQSPKEHVDDIIKDGVYLWIPNDNPKPSLDIVREIREKFPPTFDKVRYRGVETAEPVLISSMYMVLLEKTGTDWSGVGSAKLQHFGIPAKVTSNDKFSTPGRNQPVRILGETEVRLFNAIVGSDVTIDLIDQSNSPNTHKHIVNTILESDTPTDIEQIIDRELLPLGNSRNLMMVKHVLECGGVEFVREIDDPIRAYELEAKAANRVSKK